LQYTVLRLSISHQGKKNNVQENNKTFENEVILRPYEPAVYLLIVFYLHILLFFIHHLLGMLYSCTRFWILNDEREGEQIRKVKNIQYGICDKTTKPCIIERNDSRRSFCGSNRCYTCPFSRQMDSAHSRW